MRDIKVCLGVSGRGLLVKSKPRYPPLVIHSQNLNNYCSSLYAWGKSEHSEVEMLGVDKLTQQASKSLILEQACATFFTGGPNAKF